MKGTIKSNQGFYVGDICYVLSDDVYTGVWGKAGYEDGQHAVGDYEFAVGGTAHGDGCYWDENLNLYPVDAGVIGVVPLELVTGDKSDLGSVVKGATEAKYEFENSEFYIVFNNGVEIRIDTK